MIRALRIFEKHYGKDHPRTATILANLGNIWGQLGDYEKKKDLLTRALEIFEKHYGKDHPEIGTTLANLGVTWGALGDYEKATILLTRARSIFLRCYSSYHPYILKVNAALDQVSKISKSANIQQAFTGNPKRTKEKSKHATLLSWNNLANNYLQQIKLKKFNLLSNAAITRQVLVANSYSSSKKL